MAKILVVDDSITAAKFVELVLSSNGHTPALAADGDEALARLNAENFDLIILDVIMPRKNGYQLCREIKHKEQYRDIPVIMLTSKNMDADKFWAIRQGANDYLTKPCTAEALMGVVDKHVRSMRKEDSKPQEIPGLQIAAQNSSYRFNS
jgi:twitching motility two-component system response regulator PilH